MESYPPLFKNAHISPLSPNPNPNPSPNPRPNLDIPVIDFTNMDPTQLGQACRDFGLFRLTNHGVPSSLSAHLHTEAKNILSLPFDSKSKAGFLNQNVDYFWGTPAMRLSVRNINWVEGLNVLLGQIQPNEAEVQDLDWCSPLRSRIHLYGQHMAHITRTIFDALVIDLKLDHNISASYLSVSNGTLRVYRYPCCPEASNYLGMEAHTDSSVLSVLNQDDVGGLQILHNSQWLDITPISGTLIVNLGDMMQAMSDDRYKSVEHRVLANGSEERMSLCYFAFPLEDGLIVSSKYKEFTYKEFKAQVQEDIKAHGSKIGLQHFRIKNLS